MWFRVFVCQSCCCPANPIKMIWSQQHIPEDWRKCLIIKLLNFWRSLFRYFCAAVWQRNLGVDRCLVWQVSSFSNHLHQTNLRYAMVRFFKQPRKKILADSKVIPWLQKCSFIFLSWFAKLIQVKQGYDCLAHYTYWVAASKICILVPRAFQVRQYVTYVVLLRTLHLMNHLNRDGREEYHFYSDFITSESNPKKLNPKSQQQIILTLIPLMHVVNRNSWWPKENGDEQRVVGSEFDQLSLIRWCGTEKEFVFCGPYTSCITT